MNVIKITLEGLLSVIKSEKDIVINLFDQDDILLITFNLPGYKSLDDFLEDDEVLEITFPKYNTINIKIDTSKN
jgi:hypothetical protein